MSLSVPLAQASDARQVLGWEGRKRHLQSPLCARAPGQEIKRPGSPKKRGLWATSTPSREPGYRGPLGGSAGPLRCLCHPGRAPCPVAQEGSLGPSFWVPGAPGRPPSKVSLGVRDADNARALLAEEGSPVCRGQPPNMSRSKIPREHPESPGPKA